MFAQNIIKSIANLVTANGSVHIINVTAIARQMTGKRFLLFVVLSILFLLILTT